MLRYSEYSTSASHLHLLLLYTAEARREEDAPHNVDDRIKREKRQCGGGMNEEEDEEEEEQEWREW